MKNIIIIGAGAAGLMTAATILENVEQNRPNSTPQREALQFHIHIFEKNTTPGKKIIISGGGRCNVTTGITDKKILATKYTRGWEFIERAMGRFSPKKCRDWFESHGIPLKCEEDNRVFPISDDGRDIVGVFESMFAKYRDKITLHYGEGVDIVRENGGKYSVTTKKSSYEADVLIITTGGNAYSHTGSTGDGYAFARALGHTVTPLGPSLSSFLTSENWLHTLSGLAFESAKIGELTGPLLLTHFGISGPLAFMLSSHLAFENIGKGSVKIIHFSPLSEMDSKSWDEYLKKSFEQSPKKLLSRILSEKLPRRFAEAFILEYFSALRETFVGSISRKDREHLASLLGEGIPITLLERRPGDEFVTAGGVSTDELDPETMESCIHKNLYFAGEVINVDGYTGGFSLQMCWASGYTIGWAMGDTLP